MMGSRRWQSPAAAVAAAEAAEEDTGGAGGPSRRQPRLGLHRASPYGGGPRRWLPKPVASRIFATVPRDRDHAASDNNQEVNHESLEVIHERHSTEPIINAVATVPPTSVSTRFNLLPEGDGNPSHGDGLAEIENVINQRHFSRDETEHLIEILRSRTRDFNVEDQRAPESIAKGFENTAFSTPAKLIDPQSSWGTDSFPSSNVHDVGSSPIEIAKAFMEAQTSASVHESQKRKFRALSHGVESVHEPKKRKFRALSHEVEVDNSTSKVFPTVATDSSVCWPGSVVRGYPNYVTPQSNKGRTPPQPVSRKPYNGSVFRRSIMNSRRGDTYNNSSGQSQFSTPFSVESKAILEDKQVSTNGGMVQPSPSSRGHIDLFGSTSSFFPREGSADKRNSAFNLQAPGDKGIIEGRAATGHADVDNMSRGVSVSVHPKSSETAFKILKQLERTIPSPTLKPLDLRQTLAKRNASSVATNSLIRGPEFNTSNGHGQSSPNKSGNANLNLEITDAKKAQEPHSTPGVVESSEKMQSSGANSEDCETHTSHQLLKSNLTSTAAAEILDKNISKGFTFTFPVPKAPSSLLEPPPTPTLASPPRTLPITTEDIPKYTIGSSSTANRLVFSFDSTSGSLGPDGAVPTFKIGSGNKRELCFDFAGKDSVCF